MPPFFGKPPVKHDTRDATNEKQEKANQNVWEAYCTVVSRPFLVSKLVEGEDKNTYIAWFGGRFDGFGKTNTTQHNPTLVRKIPKGHDVSTQKCE